MATRHTRSSVPSRFLGSRVACLALGTAAFSSFAAASENPAAVDESFLSGTGATGGNIFSLALEQGPGGQPSAIFISGTFSGFDGEDIARIAKLDGDGVVYDEEEFDPPVLSGSFSPRIETVALVDDGRILIGGAFSQLGGVSRVLLGRLNSDGGLDTTFGSTADSNFTQAVHDVVVRNNGSAILVGNFTTFAGSDVGRIAAVNESGSLLAFGPSQGFNGPAFTVALDEGERILVGGDFSEYGPDTVNGLVRLNASGTRDTSFSIGDGFNGPVYEITVMDDGYLLVGGDFTEFDGEPANRLVKLTDSGSRVDEEDFDIGEGFNGQVRAIAVQNDGRILVGGGFTEFDRHLDDEGEPDEEQDPSEYSFIRIVRLESDGSIDMSFDPGEGADGVVLKIVLQEDGRILLAGEFFNYNGEAHGKIVRLMGGDAGDDPTTEPINYDLWVAQEFLGIVDPDIIGPTADPDWDGVVNLLEYAFGGDPNAPASVELPVIDTVEDEGVRHLKTSFIRIDAEDLVYAVEASDTPGVWDEEIWNSTDHPFDGVDGVAVEEVVDVDHIIGANGNARFLRVVVTLLEIED